MAGERRVLEAEPRVRVQVQAEAQELELAALLLELDLEPVLHQAEVQAPAVVQAPVVLVAQRQYKPELMQPASRSEDPSPS